MICFKVVCRHTTSPDFDLFVGISEFHISPTLSLCCIYVTFVFLSSSTLSLSLSLLSLSHFVFLSLLARTATHSHNKLMQLDGPSAKFCLKSDWNHHLINIFNPKSLLKSKLSWRNWFQQLKKDRKVWNWSILIKNMSKMVKIDWIFDWFGHFWTV